MRGLIVLLAACGSERTPEPPPEPKPPRPDVPKPPVDAAVLAPPAQPDLVVTLDGKPVAIHSVIAVDKGNGEAQIVFRNYAYTCKELTEGFTTRGSEPTDVSFDLRAGKHLAETGQLGWAIRGKYLFGRTATGTVTWQTEKEHGGDPLPPGAVIDTTPGKVTDVRFDFEHKPPASDGKPAPVLIVKGTAKLTGCGDSKFKDRTTHEPQPGAQIEIAGQALPIVGAGFVEKRDGGRTLAISTHPVKCVDGADYTSHRGDVGLELAWDKAGQLYAVEREGTWVDWGINQNKPALTATPNRAPRGAKEMIVTLGGSTTIGGYPVTLKGKVRALVCPSVK